MAFKKGKSGNPKGRPKLPPEYNAVKFLTQAEMTEMGSMILRHDLPTLQSIAKDPTTTVLRAMIASCAVAIIKKGDMYSLDVLLNRLIGKVKDQVVHSGIPSASAPQIILTLPDNGRIKSD